VTNARFRLVFLSQQYLRSRNCLKELAALRGQPGRTLFLIYQPHHLSRAGESLAPPPDVVAQLEAEGHLTYQLPPKLRHFSSADLLQGLIDARMGDEGALAHLFKQHSPRLNAQWLATASALCEKSSPVAVFIRFGPILLLPLLCDSLLYLWMLYMVHDASSGFHFGDFFGGVSDQGPPPPEGLRRQRGSTTPEFIMALKHMAAVLDTIFVLGMALSLPLVQRPLRSRVRRVPDAGLLLLVLRKMKVVDGKLVRVFNVADPACEDQKSRLSHVLLTLHDLGAIELTHATELRGASELAPSSGADDQASGEDGQAASVGATEAETPQLRAAGVVMVVDLDHVGAPPEHLRDCFSASGLPHCICWSVSKGFEAISGASPTDIGSMWKPLVQHTIVGQPRSSDQMVESVLCEVIRVELSQSKEWGGEVQPTKLISGGPFEVDIRDLAPPEADELAADPGSSHAMDYHGMMHNSGSSTTTTTRPWIGMGCFGRKPRTQTHPAPPEAAPRVTNREVHAQVSA